MALHTSFFHFRQYLFFHFKSQIKKGRVLPGAAFFYKLYSTWIFGSNPLGFTGAPPASIACVPRWLL